MRPARVISVLLLLVALSPAYGQTITHSLLGHERQIGPLELSIHLSLPELHLSQSKSVILSYPLARPDTTYHVESQRFGTMVLGGVAGGTAGAALGFIVADALFVETAVSLEELIDDVLIGGTIILTCECLGLAGGVHLGNGGRGSFPKVTSASTAALVLGAIPWILTGSSEVLFIAPAAQLFVAILVENRTAKLKSLGIRP